MQEQIRGRLRASWWGDALLAFALAAALVWPLFRLKYADNWASIESTFISDARFLSDHWPHPQWQPLWYGGTRFDYIYPPALRYGTAGLTKLYSKLTPARAYHLYCAFFYCLGIAGVYLLARRGAGSRGFALFAAAATALISPSFLLMPEIRANAAPWWEPQRLLVLTRYGEGPHMTALAWIGFTLFFGMTALATGRRRDVALTAICAALVVSNNFYGATALVHFFPALVWAVWVGRRDGRVFVRAAAIGALAYGLTAYWLVPSYLRVTLDNMRFVSGSGNRWSLWVTIALLAGFAVITARWAKARTDRTYTVFLAGSLLLFTLNVVGNYYLGYRVIGEPVRLVPELDLVLILSLAEALRRLWTGEWKLPFPAPSHRVAVVVLAVICLAGGQRYLRHAWKLFPTYPDYTQRVEYRITKWLSDNMPEARVYATGSVRFWFNTWFDLAQGGGGSEQGLLNPVAQTLAWNMTAGEHPGEGVAWMQCMGIDALIVNDKDSEEMYHDIQYPRRFDGVLPVVHDDGRGNRVYQVPRRYRALARVVDAAALDALPTPPDTPPYDHLVRLAEVLEKGPEVPVKTQWEGTDRLRIQAPVGPGQAVFLQMSYDPAWRAYSGGQALKVSRSQLNQIRVDPPAGSRDIDLIFELPLENAIGRVVAALAALTTLWLLARSGTSRNVSASNRSDGEGAALGMAN